MKFCWTLAPAPSFDYDNMLNNVRRGNVSTLVEAISQCDMDPCLRTIFQQGLTLTQASNFEVFANEIAEALYYAHKYGHAGRMRRVRQTVSAHLAVERPVVDFFKHNLKALHTRDYMCWFQLRSLCMDIYTAARLLADQYTEAIFYGGAQHARNLADFLENNAFTKSEIAPEVSNTLDNSNLVLTVAYLSPDAKKHITLLGESHDRTAKTFGQKLTALLESRCARAADHKTYFYVEKHVGKPGERTAPARLACNMDIVLHHVRCDPIMNAPCKSLVQVCVDVRHFEMGFLRYEIFEFCKDDEGLSKLAQTFVTQAMNEMFGLIADRQRVT